ncbi:hypothetical protein EON80_07395 [bacterium]|nr:MAG: hypothetical protein EON80_07395 [bacterium]
MNNAFRSILLSTLVMSLGTGITQAQPQNTLNTVPENPALTVEELQQMTGGPQRVIYVKQDGELSEAISYWYYKAGLDAERVVC